MYVCMYVYMYIWYISMYVCMYVCMIIHICIYFRFILNGSLDEILIIQGTNLPTQAIEGRAGDYRCEVCINIRNICQDSIVTVDIRGE